MFEKKGSWYFYFISLVEVWKIGDQTCSFMMCRLAGTPKLSLILIWRRSFWRRPVYKAWIWNPSTWFRKSLSFVVFSKTICLKTKLSILHNYVQIEDTSSLSIALTIKRHCVTRLWNRRLESSQFSFAVETYDFVSCSGIRSPIYQNSWYTDEHDAYVPVSKNRVLTVTKRFKMKNSMNPQTFPRMPACKPY